MIGKLKGFFTPTPKVVVEDPLLAVLRQQSEMSARTLEGVCKAMEAMASAQAAQTTAFNEYLGMFKLTPAASTHHTITDKDEWERELLAAGFPVTGTPEEQATWVLKQTA
jgi:hypothetical protein